MTDSLALIHHFDAVEAAANRDLYAAVARDLKTSTGMETLDIAGATLLMAPGIPSTQFNRVIGLGNSQEPNEDALDVIIERYRNAGIRDWWIQLSPGAQPNDLAALLAARGFSPAQRTSWAKMLRGAEPVPRAATGLEVRAVEPGEEQALAETICIAFEMPVEWAPLFAQLPARDGWQAAAAFDNGTLIGGGLLYVTGNTGWLGAGGVLPAARGRHAHRALMTLRIELAISAGCKYISTETGDPIGDEPNPSLRNMTACGFSKLYSRHNFATGSSEDSGDKAS